jgi:uncharacterized protein (DUF433 family)
METNRIARDPDVLGGKPVIAGTRMSVELVLEYLAEDLNAEHLLAAFPHIEPEDVRACLEYALGLVMAEQDARVAAHAAG